MFIEKLLKEKCELEGTSEYFSQWDFDQKELKSALSSIQEYFPHYTLHGESHSIKIINNIIKILGIETLNKFSSLDLWLLLESAYVHDIGMYLTSDRIKDTLKSPGFISYFKKVEKNKRHPLNQYSQSFKIIKEKLHYKGTEYKLNNEHSFRYLLADYLRNDHGKESEKIINDLSRIGINCQNNLTPKRIRSLVGKIVSAHTKSFSEVMKLPYKVNGILLEEGHPKFIACMLRLGDLLDIDNDRHSEVFLNNIKSTIPSESLNHLNKHRSINHLRIDSKRIEISAEISKNEFQEEAYSIATLTQEWFKYIENEVKNQMVNWNDIVPKKDYGYLPTLGKLEVKLEGYDYINLNNEPKFTIDTENALELLKDAGVYSSPILAFRELIQNAIDATYLKIWIDHKEKIQKIEENSKNMINYDEYEKLLAQYPISITAEKEKDELILSIKDLGIGFSKITLKFLEEVASSKNDFTRTEMIKKMPVLIQPSGNFGVGFQSIFLLADIVTITTTSLYDNMTYTLTLKSPSTGKGSIYITSQNKEVEEPYGTEVKFSVKKEAFKFFPKPIDLEAKKKNIEMNDFFTLNQSEIQGIENNILNNYKNIILPIYFNKNIILKEGNKFKHYFAEEELEISHSVSYLQDGNRNYSGKIFFKNQLVQSHGASISHFNIDINILGKVAGNVLQINRSEFRSDFQNEINNIRNKAIIDYIDNSLLVKETTEPNLKSHEQLLFFDISLTIFSLEDNLKRKLKKKRILFNNINCSILDFWRFGGVQLLLDNKQITINYFDFLNNVDAFIIHSIKRPKKEINFRNDNKKILQILKRTLTLEDHFSHYYIPDSLRNTWTNQLFKDYDLAEIKKETNSNFSFKFSKNKNDTKYNLKELLELVKDIIIQRNPINFNNVAGLFVLPVLSGFKTLEYKITPLLPVQNFITSYLSIQFNQAMLSPFKLNFEGDLERIPLEIYSHLIYKFRLQEEIKEETIKKACEAFYKELDGLSKI